MTSNLKLALLLGEKNINCFVTGGKVVDTGMLAGTKYRGDFEERIKNFIDDIIKKGDTILVKASHSMHFDNIVEKLNKDYE